MRAMGEYDLSGLSDSRILYMRNPPKFVYIFVIAVVIIIVGAIIWAAVTVKAEEVEVGGIIATEGSTEIIPQVSGTIDHISAEEGQVVVRGDIIFTFDSSSVEKEKADYSTALAQYEERLGYVEVLIKSLEEKSIVNPFISSGNQNEFYIIFQNYLVQCNATVGDEAKESLRYQTILSYYSEMNTCKDQIASAESYVDKYSAELEKYYIVALCDGVVHYDSELKVGVVLQAGSSVGSVSPADGCKYIESSLSSTQRAMLEAGQDCRFTVNGLMQSEYGSVTGRIDSIASDASITESGVYFKMKISFDRDYLSDSNGNKVNIVNGMTVDSWCVYEKSTYLDYFFDKLGIHF